MDISRFVANLAEARRVAIIVVEAKNVVAREHTSDLLDKTVENMIQELSTTIIGQCRIDKDVLLKNLLEDAESTIQYFSRKD